MATLSQDQKQLVQEKAKAIRVSIVQSVTAANLDIQVALYLLLM